ncbi:SpoIIE family protein phosphatase [Geobacter sp.]|uniref:sodium:solute symporter family transporter n=1 Tax=Geobacter sp. TaxID=46610 RepID=UPI00262B14E4|nr:SpoIIE family protein phosphatase [Geobacter sp.]
MILSIELVTGVSLLYIVFLFMVAYYADKKREAGKSIIANPIVYTLSIAVYHTTWTFYGSVGKAATTGIDFLLIYLGPTLIAFSWWFLLRKIVRIAKENNITSIADFISSRYGKSQWLGAIITVIALLGIMPYIALQLKAVSSTFDILCGYPYVQLPLLHGNFPLSLHTNFFAAIILAVFGVIFGARRLVSSERHEGLVAAVAVESVVKLAAFLSVGIYVTYGLFDGFGDIFSRISSQGKLLDHLTTLGGEGETSYARWFSTLYLAMGAIILLPRQFHVMVIENSNEEHIKKAMWLLPAYMFLINLFVMPIALGGILQTGGILGADFFVLTLPLRNGHSWLTLLAFLGGFSAAAGMVMVESVAISTMILNHLLMPIIVSLNPRPWFPRLLINLKRISIFVVVLLGYLYQTVVGETFMLVNMGLISFAAAAQFGPALIGGLYWRRGNKSGALAGIILGFLFWAYTLLIPSFIMSGWLSKSILDQGPFGIALLKPTELFGLAGFDIWTHSVFWSLLFNVGAYLACSILLDQSDRERDQMRKFVDVFKAKANGVPWETKRMSKPVTIMQFVTLMSKFIGEEQAHTAIAEYLGNREINEQGGVSEFELPKLKRFTEKTLAGSVGAAAAGAIVESYLSDLGTRMEPVYDIFSTVQASLAESREALYVRLRASEIMNRTLDLQIIMDDLLNLVLKEFKLDLAVIRLIDGSGMLRVRSYSGKGIAGITGKDWEPESETYIGEAFLANRIQFVNDTQYIAKPISRELMKREGIKSFAHIPIARKGEQPLGIMSVFSKGIVGLFNEPFLNLLESLAGQLAQAVKIVKEMEEKERERAQKERALLDHARVVNEMEIAKQIQLSLLPSSPPTLPGIAIAGRCQPATHVGGDYYDFFLHGEHGLDLVIADVSGHSVGAALIMAETRSVLRAQASSDKNVDAILATLNELLYDDLTAAELFITMFYVRFNTENRILSYANAGHNPPLVHRDGMTTCTEIDADGLVLGVRREVFFEHRSISLQEGDIVLLYTDGITETQNREGEFFGSARLCDILAANRDRSADEVVEAILREVGTFCGEAPQNDDISMVAFKVLSVPSVDDINESPPQMV